MKLAGEGNPEYDTRFGRPQTATTELNIDHVLHIVIGDRHYKSDSQCFS